MSKPRSKQTAQKPAERVGKAKPPAAAPAASWAALVEEAGPHGPVNGLPDHPTSKRIRQASVLRMQRRNGNGAVQRALGRRSAANGKADLRRQTGPQLLLRQIEDEEKPGPEEKSAAQGGAGQAQQAVGESSAGQEQQTAQGVASPAQGAAAQGAGSQAQSPGGGPVTQAGLGQALGEAGQQQSQTPAGAGAAAATGEHAPESPEEDQGFLAIIEQIRQQAEQQKSHPQAEQKAQEAQDAAESPQAELESKAKKAHVQEVQAAETPAADKSGLKAQIMQKIQALTPKTADEADRFKGSNKLGGLKADLKGKMAEEKARSIEPMKKKSQAGPNQGGIAPKPVTPLSPPQPLSPLPQFNAEPAVPKAKPGSEVEKPLKEKSKSLDEQMAEADITEEQLQNANEPEFQSALEQKKEAQQKTKEAPQEYRQQEQEQISQAKEEANSSANDKLLGMQEVREQHLSQVGQEQGQAKSADEKKRQEVAVAINGIYERTKSQVDDILNGLDARVVPIFEAGAAAAQAAFENYVSARMEAYKQRRYGGALGWTQWLKDKVLGMPPEVNQFFAEGRQMYISQMDALIDNAVATIAGAIQEAKATVEQGRMEIEEYVSSLPADLQQVGQEAAADIQGSFDQLEAGIVNKEQELVEVLAAQYQANLQVVDAKIETLQGQTIGLLEAAGNAIGGVIKTIQGLTEKLSSILSRVGSAVKNIMKNPVGFVGNLLGAVKTGLMNFVGNIATHLRKGLISWLFKALSDAGIELPESLDLKGIMSLVMRVLGVTWASIRARAAALFGERVVGVLENVFDIFKSIKSEGLGGLFNFVQDQVSGIKDTIMDALRQMVITEVVQKGIQRLLGLLGGPANAFVSAVETIYKVVMWFIGNAQQLGSLVSAIMDSISAIAGGAVGQATAAIEQALARAIPATISFLANLLGLGDIGGKIRQIIEGVRGPVNRVVDWILNKAGDVARGLGGLLGGGEAEAE